MNKNQSFIFVTFATIYIALTLLELETLADKVFLTGLVCSTYFAQYSLVRSMFNDRVVQ